MSKFHFRLATLLRLRQAARDERRLQLAESQRADQELHDRLETLKTQRKQLQNECREAAGPGRVNLARLVEAHHFDAALRLEEMEMKQRRRALAVEIEQRRQSLVEADRDVQSLEKLHDGQWQNYYQEENRRENKRLDEAAIQIRTR